MIDEGKCSLALIDLSIYVNAKFFPIVQHDLNSFCLAMTASHMQSCPATVIFSVQVTANVLQKFD